MEQASGERPPTWLFVLAFGIVYLAYGLNYLAIREGVHSLPPLLFSGAHVTLAGLILFAWLVLRRQACGVSRSSLAWAALAGLVVFVGGTGLVTLGEKTLASDEAAILRASTPVWVALIECARPGGERLGALAWAGLAVALVGVGVMVVPSLEGASTLTANAGVFYVLGSALAWAVGAVLLRHHRPAASNVVATAYQMSIGGFGMLFLGLALGEAQELETAHLTGVALASFLFLLLVHSLLGFLALNWLLQYVSAPLVTTKFYVTPAVALVAGYFVLGEPLTAEMLTGMGLILAGVLLLMWKPSPTHS